MLAISTSMKCDTQATPITNPHCSVAAFFGLDHNIDQSGQCIVVNRNENTRMWVYFVSPPIPLFVYPPKSIIKKFVTFLYAIV